jgi:replicative DNA helicase
VNKTGENQDNFSKFGKSFQEDLCHLILVDRPFADQMFEVLDLKFLELKYLRKFIEQIKIYRKRYGVHPTRKIMSSVVRTGLSDQTEPIQIRIRDYFARLLAAGDSPESSEYIKDIALDFCKKQKLKEALITSVDLIKNSSFDEVSKVIDDALKLGNDNNLGYDYLLDFEERFQKKARGPITTGWQQIDEITKGGLGKGELGVVIAPTGAGKSMVLVHLGAQALKEGKNVLHYTLELADVMVACRYDSAITGVDLQSLTVFKEKIYEEVKEIPGRLVVKEYPTRSASIQTIKNHIDKLKRRDFTPDLIIIDYGDLIKPEFSRKEEKRHQLETIYEELRGIAQANGCPIWTASQTNRSGLNAEVITMESISEAFNKCFVADFIFTVSRTIEDKNTNTGRVYVAKNRNGPDGLVYPIFMDTSCVKIKLLNRTEESIEDIVTKSSREKFDKLRQKYADYKKAKGGDETDGTVK